MTDEQLDESIKRIQTEGVALILYLKNSGDQDHRWDATMFEPWLQDEME